MIPLLRGNEFILREVGHLSSWGDHRRGRIGNLSLGGIPYVAESKSLVRGCFLCFGGMISYLAKSDILVLGVVTDDAESEILIWGGIHPLQIRNLWLGNDSFA